MRNHHGALHAEAQFSGRILLQLAGGKRGRGVAAAFFLIDRADQPVGLLERCADLLRILAVGDFDLFFAFAHEAGVECRRRARRQVRVDGPVFFFLERFDFALALYDQSQRDGLHTSGGKTAPDFIP